MSEHCQELCRPLPRRLGFAFGFRAQGFDVGKEEDRRMLAEGFAVGIAQALAVANATVEVNGLEAKAQVACGCQGTRGRACRSCSTLEAMGSHGSYIDPFIYIS